MQLDATYNPVSIHVQQCKITASRDTLLEPLERPKLQFQLQSYEYTPRAYIKHTASGPVETDAASVQKRLSDILMSPDDASSITESATSGAPVADSASVGTIKSMEEERNDVVDPTETMTELFQEVVVEKMEGRETCSGYVEGNSDTYESLESTMCRFELPVDEFPFSEPLELAPSCGDSSSVSFCIDDDHLHSFSHTECPDTSRSSGYISNQIVVS